MSVAYIIDEILKEEMRRAKRKRVYPKKRVYSKGILNKTRRTRRTPGRRQKNF